MSRKMPDPDGVFHLPVDLDRDPVADHVLALDPMDLVQLGNAGLDDDVHARIFDNFPHVFAKGLFFRNFEKIAVGLINHHDPGILVDNDDPVRRVFEEGLQEFPFIALGGEFPDDLLEFGDVLEYRNGPDHVSVLLDRGPVGNIRIGADFDLPGDLRDAAFDNLRHSGVRDDLLYEPSHRLPLGHPEDFFHGPVHRTEASLAVHLENRVVGGIQHGAHPVDIMLEDEHDRVDRNDPGVRSILPYQEERMFLQDDIAQEFIRLDQLKSPGQMIDFPVQFIGRSLLRTFA